jgi:hypothetical protein
MQVQERAQHPELLSDDSLANAVADGTADKQIPSAGETQKIIDGLPERVRSGLVSADGRTAVVSFGIPLIPVGDMNKLIDKMEAEIVAPPNVDVAPAGHMVLTARTVTALTANRNLATIIALLAVAGGLFVVYRSVGRALVPLLPIVIVVGWSSAFMYAIGLDLNPLTAVLGSLIIAIGTEFTILLMERYVEEKHNGLEPREAMLTAVSRIGPAITASVATVVAGFGTLMASSFPMLKDFGKVVVIDVMFALVATLVVLPAVVVWLDGFFSSQKPLRERANLIWPRR